MITMQNVSGHARLVYLLRINVLTLEIRLMSFDLTLAWSLLEPNDGSEVELPHPTESRSAHQNSWKRAR